ncbi:MAG: hypothetical protein IKD20_02550 [Clostridia bacterium]|nr:hypothetical protein [Clostridia bacterium]
MKRLLPLLLSIALCLLAGCTHSSDTIKVYMPDGAPSIALAHTMHDDCIEGVEYHVVSPTTIVSTVSGGNPLADVCILPINSAVKLLGEGDTYRLLGTVTHGNLYLLGYADEVINIDNISSLIGERIGVLQLNAVPGLTLKAILTDLSIPYNEVSVGSIDRPDSINLQNIDASMVGMLEGVNYYLLAEPAVSVKCSIPSLSLRVVGSLQDMYGENGYPQAVIVAKGSILSNHSSLSKVRQIVNSIDSGVEWAKQNTSLTAEAISSHLPDDYTPSIRANFLTPDTIDRCNVRYIPAERNSLNAFLTKLNFVSTTPWGYISEDFIYSL